MSLPVLLTVVFVVLKVMGVIFWSWWWVTSPIWIALALVFVMAVLSAILNLEFS